MVKGVEEVGGWGGGGVKGGGGVVICDAEKFLTAVGMG